MNLNTKRDEMAKKEVERVKGNSQFLSAEIIASDSFKRGWDARDNFEYDENVKLAQGKKVNGKRD